MKNKRAAMEMSIGTIVTIVLSMTLLIGGIMLVTNISKSGADIVDITDSQVKNQINQLFGEDNGYLSIFGFSNNFEVLLLL